MLTLSLTHCDTLPRPPSPALALRPRSEVKRAYEALIDEEERKRVHGILQQSRQRVLRERKRLKKKGVEERNLPPLKEQLQTETMKVRLSGADTTSRQPSHPSHPAFPRS